MDQLVKKPKVLTGWSFTEKDLVFKIHLFTQKMFNGHQICAKPYTQPWAALVKKQTGTLFRM
jgi:hypothetical protein